MAQMNLLTEQKQTHGHKDLWLPRGREFGTDREFGVGRCNYYVYSGEAMRSDCTAQGTISNLLG